MIIYIKINYEKLTLYIDTILAILIISQQLYKIIKVVTFIFENLVNKKINFVNY